MMACLFQSSTFWSQTCLFFLGAVTLLLSSVLLVSLLTRRVAPLKYNLHRQNGAAASVDFVLTLPIVMLVIFLTIQFALLANASMQVHYAAYVAAHSARLHYSNFSSLKLKKIEKKEDIKNILFDTGDQKGTDAAKLALVSIGSANKKIKNNPTYSSNEFKKALEDYLIRLPKKSITREKDVYSVNNNALLKKAEYVFDNKNTTVTINHSKKNLMSSIFEGWNKHQGISKLSDIPIKAQVSFDYVLTLPLAGPVFGNKSKEEYFYRTLKAEVVVL